MSLGFSIHGVGVSPECFRSRNYFWVWDLGCAVYGLRFVGEGVPRPGFCVQGFGFRVLCSGFVFRVLCSGFRVESSGFQAEG